MWRRCSPFGQAAQGPQLVPPPLPRLRRRLPAAGLARASPPSHARPLCQPARFRAPTTAGYTSYFIFRDAADASAAAFCRAKGYGGAGSVKVTALASLGQGVGAVNLAARTVCSEPTCVVRLLGFGSGTRRRLGR